MGISSAAEMQPEAFRGWVAVELTPKELVSFPQRQKVFMCAYDVGWHNGECLWD